jgi:hypothetical protein
MADERGNGNDPTARGPVPGQGALKARQRVIGAGLKRLYQEVLEEGIPDDFNDLLSRFDEDTKVTPEIEGGTDR